MTTNSHNMMVKNNHVFMRNDLDRRFRRGDISYITFITLLTRARIEYVMSLRKESQDE